jgi:hypothetical protein
MVQPQGMGEHTRRRRVEQQVSSSLVDGLIDGPPPI